MAAAGPGVVGARTPPQASRRERNPPRQARAARRLRRVLRTEPDACVRVPDGWNESVQGGTGPNRTASTYNVRNQLSSFTVGGTTTNLAYFGDGQDDLYTVGSTTYRNTILGLTQIGTDTYTRDNSGALVAQNTSNGLKYLHLDALGSVRGVSGSTGAVDYRLNYDPYGRALTGTGIATAGSSTTRVGYAGGTWINEGSMYHFGARYYDPSLLRWTMPDPVLQPNDPGQANRYAYVAGNPTNASDPSGTVSCSTFGIGGICKTASHAASFVGRNAGHIALGVHDTLLGVGFGALAISELRLVPLAAVLLAQPRAR